MRRTSTPSDVFAELLLSEAYEFVLSGWCQGSLAVDECGRPIEPSSAFARRWSALGALERAWGRAEEPPEVAKDAYECARLALTAAMNDVTQAWNDRADRRQSEVLDALAEAVQLVVASGPNRPDEVGKLIGDLGEAEPRTARGRVTLSLRDV